MHNQLQGLKIALLVANGFDETPYMEMQRVWKDSGAVMKLVSVSPGLVNSWRDGGWGLNYLTDHKLSSALAADFDVLMVPGGRRGVDKLMTTAHTKRFVNGFIGASKPVMLMNEATELLAFASVDGYKIATDGVEIDGALFTAMSSDETLSAVMQEAHDFVSSCMEMSKAA